MKGNMVVTVGKGKLGSMVGYRITNSNDKEKQGLRAYVAHPSNPKSFLQASQRVLIANVARTYGTLKPVLRRAFEDIKYGGMSYQEFLKLNLKDTVNGPWVPKNYVTYVPAAYRISKGTLPSLGYIYDSTRQDFTSAIASISALSGNTITLKALSEATIAANPSIQNGDQMTWIVGFEYEGGAFQFRYKSVTLDTNDTTTTFVVTSKGELNIGNNIILMPDDKWTISGDSGLEDETVCAACCILSRDGNGQHLRSSEVMAVDTTNTAIAPLMTAEAKFDAIKSFMAEGANTDWPTETLV